MANDTTSSGKASFWQDAQKYVKTEKKEIAAFLNGLSEQKKAFQQGKSNARSWVKEAKTGGFNVKLGKIPTTFEFPTKEQVVKFLDDAENAAKEDAEFIAEIEKAYGEPTKPRRGRPAKTAEQKAAEAAAKAAAEKEAAKS
ncbi:hypothetical protein [Sinorhizobium meliloti]|uniref:hypothetical protein n=1 Tax=Rhizobium meliloti TaxID=382 RepID=UPI00299DBA5E|nr:hypothetical protein [Sinorhizobium meliloti]MDW9991060.1 hypothetical protein [Sinorhizobium meliloti]MDX0245460.1 hypothetical protein [Sinorhizobium meliloti]MDX0401536.1 hypothetical protein [Sinorhizobium meliloti]